MTKINLVSLIICSACLFFVCLSSLVTYKKVEKLENYVVDWTNYQQDRNTAMLTSILNLSYRIDSLHPKPRENQIIDGSIYYRRGGY